MVYKKWAFKFFIYTIVLNIIVAYLVIQSNIFNDYSTQLLICIVLSNIVLILGIIFGVISYKKKEGNDIKKKFGLFGNLAILLLSIVLQTLENV